jgi:hypothetical protein
VVFALVVLGGEFGGFERLQRIVNSCERDYYRSLKELVARVHGLRAPQPEDSTTSFANLVPLSQNSQPPAYAAPKPAPESPKEACQSPIDSPQTPTPRSRRQRGTPEYFSLRFLRASAPPRRKQASTHFRITDAPPPSRTPH